MPYKWTDPADGADHAELHLWPYQSLSASGYVRIVSFAAIMLALPLLSFLGSWLWWGLLPFLALALFGLKWALDRNRHSRQILEVLTLTKEMVEIARYNPTGEPQKWSCNRYWARVDMHETQGPVPYYITLSGNGRTVEIGAFLSDDERKALFHDLQKTVPTS